MSKVSIIVPVYGAEKYVGAMLDSLIAQTFIDWEAILVDDGSRDCSGQICDEYSFKDSRIKVIHKQNGGVSSARNEGLVYATGDFITFVDADDVLNPQFLSNFSYDQSLDFEIQGFYLNHINATNRNAQVKPKETKIASLKDIYAEAELLKLTRGPVCKLMKTSIIKDNNITFPLGLSFGEDAIFVKRYLLNCSGNARSIASADYIYNDFDDPNSLTHRSHLAQAMYDVARMDWDLYEQLETRFGSMPEELDMDFKKIRTLEFYQSIVVCMREKKHTFQQKKAFLQKAKDDMFQLVKGQVALPPTYRVIKFSLLYFPTWLATFVLFKVL